MLFLLETWQSYLIGGVVLLVFIAIFFITFLLNKKTPKPDGCKTPGEECEGCSMLGCANHPEKKKDENKESGGK